MGSDRAAYGISSRSSAPVHWESTSDGDRNFKQEVLILNSEELAHHIAELSLQKKAQDVIIMDLKALTSITDYFIICSGDSPMQVKAISDHIIEQLEHEKMKVWHVEGYEGLNWVLLDLVDVVVHIFQPDIRDFYALEKLWGDAIVTRVED